MQMINQEQERIPIKDLIVLQNGVTGSQVCSLLGFQAFNMAMKKGLYLNHGNYQSKNIKSVLTKLKQLKIQCLSLDCNYEPQILKDLSVCNFSQLQVLSLNANRIKSIEKILMNLMPELKLLNLQSNEINNVRVLRRCEFNALQNLFITNNKISQIDGMEQGNFQNLLGFQLSYNKIASMDSIIKMNSNIKTIFVQKFNPNQIIINSRIRRLLTYKNQN